MNTLSQAAIIHTFLAANLLVKAVLKDIFACSSSVADVSKLIAGMELMVGLLSNMVELCMHNLWFVTNSSGSSIKFQDVVSVIAKFAFIVTPYPLILSMEIHCGPEQQLKMAQIFRETLGDELLLGNLEGFNGGKLPSPEDLKYKILLKVRSRLIYTNDRSKTHLRT
jgi:hypothetical protein